MIDNFWEKYNLEEDRYYNFFDFKNSDFFFSDYIIITESSNDCKVVQQLLDLSGIDSEELGISLIPASGERNIKYPYAIATELEIPFICIVDRDVFQPYRNEKREDSLDEQGIPLYRNSIKKGSPIMELLSKEDQIKIIDCFSQEKYNDGLSILEKYHIVSMRYAFEVDLVICKSYCETMCNVIGITPPTSKFEHLLTNYSNAIKKYGVINETLQRQGIQNLPKSYRKIINNVKEMTEQSK